MTVRPRVSRSRRRQSALFAAALVACQLLKAAGMDAAEDARSAAAPDAETRVATARPVDFGRQIQPILARRCYKCHGPDKNEGGLRLNAQETALAELDSGLRAIVAGNPGDSALVERISDPDEHLRMPPEEQPLSAEEIELFRRWITEGAAWEQHWAFQPPQVRPVPPVERRDWPRNPVDTFILKRLEGAGLPPSPRADPVALIRRATFDLTGLPPTPEEVETFLADDEPDAWHRLIDRLLASPAYGEKWGRHWLDLVRYAETNSFERDAAKPNVWRYRDYVIRSFNADKPYDRFIREQLAGDELDEATRETIIATGYYRLGLWDDEPVDPVQAYYDELDDIVRTTGEVFLGLTIGCARCHDHKIDPVPQADYYRMLAFFHDLHSYGTRADQRSNNQTDISPPDVATAHERVERERRDVRRALRRIEEAAIRRMPGVDQRKSETDEREKLLAEKLEQFATAEEFERYRELKSRLSALEHEQKQLPERELALSVNRSRREPPVTYVLLRGGAHAHGDPVEPGFPAIFATPDPVIPEPPGEARSAGRRRVLAEWIASPDNRLTARVMANRLWQFHFGRGLVRSPNDFGHQGERPTHPELLEWLAGELVEGQGTRDKGQQALTLNSQLSTLNSPTWSLKRLHRLI
ncbi:MAG TPA: PSD1 and planctomycete cytochrome C domain-containing protein, partial [Planctomycetaceae bacterium]|nr:PSD1 and planctomycete cytochrome C domain-containing protein [Planctomycetaceae bacterium]